MNFVTQYDDPPIQYDLNVGSKMKLRGYSEHEFLSIAEFSDSGVLMTDPSGKPAATIASEDLADAILEIL